MWTPDSNKKPDLWGRAPLFREKNSQRPPPTPGIKGPLFRPLKKPSVKAPGGGETGSTGRTISGKSALQEKQEPRPVSPPFGPPQETKEKKKTGIPPGSGVFVK